MGKSPTSGHLPDRCRPAGSDPLRICGLHVTSASEQVLSKVNGWQGAKGCTQGCRRRH